MTEAMLIGILGAAALGVIIAVCVWIGSRTAAFNDEILAARDEDARDYPHVDFRVRGYPTV